MKNFKNFMFFVMACALVSCSGDDPIDDIEEEVIDEPEVLTGVFRDSEVSGLSYVTDSQTGTTNEDGEFKYVDGETVVFSVGDILVGSAEASSEMSPVSIASTSNATVETQEVKNMAAFLQTLDSDNDPSNGITIEESMVDAISKSSINFSESITKILGELVSEINAETGSNLRPVYPEQAAAHLAETLEESYESTNLAFESFVPVVETWHSYARNSVEWIHETNDDGLLTGSYMYEKYPYRLLSEYTYSGHDEMGIPSNFVQKNYVNGNLVQTISRDVTSSEGQVESFINYLEDGTLAGSSVFTELDEQNRVTEARILNSDGEFANRQRYVFDEDGNNIQRTTYSSESGNEEANILQEYTYTFNERGDISTAKSVRGDVVGLWEYIYRNDGTLEERVIDYNYNDREERTQYDENEDRVILVITEGDYRSEYISFFDNGDPHIVETYHLDFMFELVTYNEDRSSTWKTINEQDLTYKIEYKDAQGNILTTEYYDAEGNLLSTVTA